MKKLLIIIYGVMLILIILGNQLAQAQMASSSSGFSMCPSGDIKLAVGKNQVPQEYIVGLEQRGYFVEENKDFYIISNRAELIYTSNLCSSYANIKTYLNGTVAFIGLGASLYGIYAATLPVSVTVTIAGAAGVTAIVFVADEFICNKYFEEENEKKTKMLAQEAVCEILQQQNNNKSVCKTSGGDLIRLESGNFENMCTPILRNERI